MQRGAPLFDWTPPPVARPIIPPSGVPVDVAQHFERITLELIGIGFKRHSADAILHRIRWHFQVERGVRTFKCNNNWTALLARWFINRHPEADEFFEPRRMEA